MFTIRFHRQEVNLPTLIPYKENTLKFHSACEAKRYGESTLRALRYLGFTDTFSYTVSPE